MSTCAILEWFGPRRVAATIVLVTALASRVPPAQAQGSQRLSLGMSLTSSYDSNLLEYSADQLSLFERGTNPDRFSLQSTDDLVWNPALSLGWELAGPRGRRHALRATVEGDFHQKNGTADFRSIRGSWRESWSRDRRLSLGYYRLPEFYLRQLFDEDVVPAFPGLSRYRRAEFSLDIASADWSQRVGRSNTFAAGWQLERRRYNADFRERDSDTNEGELEWGWTRLPRRGALALRGRYRINNAEGTDGDDAPGIVPDDPDVSYHGFGAGTHGEMEITRAPSWRLVGDADYEFSVRDYDSDRPADRYHFGRRDALHEFEFGIAVRWRRHWVSRAFLRLEANRARLGSTAPSTTDTGDYSKAMVGLRLDWNGVVWRTALSSKDAEE